MPMRAVTDSESGRTGRARRRGAIALAAMTVAGGLSFGVSGVSGAASSGGSGGSASSLQSQVNSASKGFQEALKHFNCATAEQRLGRAARIDAKFAKKYANLQSKLSTKQQQGKAKRVKFFEKRLAAAHKEQARLENAHFRALQAKLAKLAQQKCHVSAPSSAAGGSAGQASS